MEKGAGGWANVSSKDGPTPTLVVIEFASPGPRSEKKLCTLMFGTDYMLAGAGL